ncbi:hypothetical protein VNO78_07273 [Psophocarpus tetragonolobus]|uniref:Uncharacterized protein n=1 Tax=Psophocarpus tetragonolobus TaxID=3891 RepID=A0AAN9SV02_PSOTE
MGLVRLAKTAPKQMKRCMPHSRGTVSDVPEEGGDEVKSAWPLWAGPHTCYNGNYNGKQGYFTLWFEGKKKNERQEIMGKERVNVPEMASGTSSMR